MTLPFRRSTPKANSRRTGLFSISNCPELLPGVLGNEESALSDSFQDNLLAPPLYTRPAEFKGLKVPDVLLSGDHKKIEDWRLEQSLEKTKTLRPDLLEGE